ncbi:MAG: hypothetical protein ACEQSA_02595 [Weeksellaceae bacterium]
MTAPAPSPADLAKEYVQTEEFRKFIETEVLKVIKNLAEANETPPEKLQDIAKATLELIQPNLSMDQLYINAVKLDDKYSELAPVVVVVMTSYEDKYHHRAVNNVSALILKGEYDQAQDLVKKVLLFKGI